MRNHINHITKTEFLPCFIAAFDVAITKSNILGGFRGAGLIPHDPEAVISKLDVRLQTPPLPTIEDTPWESRRPKNTVEVGSQSAYLRERIRRHVDSSPTSIIESLEQLSKGAAMMAHTLVLMKDQVAQLQSANKAATRRRAYKRQRVQRDGALTVSEGARLTVLREFGARGNGEREGRRAHADGGEPSQRRCKQCGETGHNLRTFRQQVDIPEEL